MWMEGRVGRRICSGIGCRCEFDWEWVDNVGMGMNVGWRVVVLRVDMCDGNEAKFDRGFGSVWAIIWVRQSHMEAETHWAPRDAEVFCFAIFSLSISLSPTVSPSPCLSVSTSPYIEEGPGPAIAFESCSLEIALGRPWWSTVDELVCGSLTLTSVCGSSSSADDDDSGSRPSCHLRMAFIRFLRPR
jgi:hypothetical protein